MSDLKLTNIKLNSRNFREYSKAVSGLFLVTSGESITEIDLKLVWSIKAGFEQNNDNFITRKLRVQLAHAFELKPQTLYNRLSDLKRKGILVEKDNKITLSPVFNDRANVTITHNYEIRELPKSVDGETARTA